MTTEFADAVRLARARRDVRDAVHALYDDLQREIDTRRPLCQISGRCCRFEEYGHRLMVTTAETAAFFHDTAALPPDDFDGRGCPYQRGKLCTVHAARPLGCRMFFCDATTVDWQHDAYERLHRRLKDLHLRLDVPYFYMEWRQALGAVREAVASHPSPGTPGEGRGEGPPTYLLSRDRALALQPVAGRGLSLTTPRAER